MVKQQRPFWLIEDDDDGELLDIDVAEPCSKKRLSAAEKSCSVKIYYNGQYIWEVAFEEFPEFIRTGDSLLSVKLAEAVAKDGVCDIVGPENLLPSFESMIQYLLDDWSYRESFGGAIESPLDVTAPVHALLHWQVVLPGGLPTSPTFIFTSAWSFTQQRGWMALAHLIPYIPSHKIITQHRGDQAQSRLENARWVPIIPFKKVAADLWLAPAKYDIELKRSGIECLRRYNVDTSVKISTLVSPKVVGGGGDDKFEDAVDTRRESPVSSSNELESAKPCKNIILRTNVDGDHRAISVTVPYLTKRFHTAEEREITYFQYVPADFAISDEEAKAPFYYLVINGGAPESAVDNSTDWRIQIELSPSYSLFLLPGCGLKEAPFAHNEVVDNYETFKCPNCALTVASAPLGNKQSWFRTSARGLGLLGCTSRKHLANWVCVHEYENSVPRLSSVDLQSWFDEFGLNAALDVEKVIDYTWGYLLVLSTDAIYRSNGVCSVIIASHLDYRSVHPEPVPIYYKGVTTLASKDVAICIVNLRRVYMLYAKILYVADFEWGDTKVVLGGGTKFEGTPASADSSLSSADELGIFFPQLGLRLQRQQIATH